MLFLAAKVVVIYEDRPIKTNTRENKCLTSIYHIDGHPFLEINFTWKMNTFFQEKITFLAHIANSRDMCSKHRGLSM